MLWNPCRLPIRCCRARAGWQSDAVEPVQAAKVQENGLGTNKTLDGFYRKLPSTLLVDIMEMSRRHCRCWQTLAKIMAVFKLTRWCRFLYM
jgi:hypothetical protein